MKWGEKSERAGGKQKGQWQNRWIKVLGSAVAAGIVYWYVTGEMDVWLYAISSGIRGNRVFEGDVGSPQKMAGIWWQEEKSRSGERIERKARKWIYHIKTGSRQRLKIAGRSIRRVKKLIGRNFEEKKKHR